MKIRCEGYPGCEHCAEGDPPMELQEIDVFDFKPRPGMEKPFATRNPFDIIRENASLFWEVKNDGPTTEVQPFNESFQVFMLAKFNPQQYEWVDGKLAQNPRFSQRENPTIGES